MDHAQKTQFSQKNNVTLFPTNSDMVQLGPKASAIGLQAVTTTEEKNSGTIATWKVQDLAQQGTLAFVSQEHLQTIRIVLEPGVNVPPVVKVPPSENLP